MRNLKAPLQDGEVTQAQEFDGYFSYTNLLVGAEISLMVDPYAADDPQSISAIKPHPNHSYPEA